MKILGKFLTVLFTAIIISNSSYAEGVFVGDDYFDRSQFQIKSFDLESDLEKYSKFNYRTNAGYRFDTSSLSGSAEVFFDNTQISSRNFVFSKNAADKIDVESRYGAKLNAAFYSGGGISTFVSIGLANVKRNQEIYTNNPAPSKYELTPVYGVGLKMDLPMRVSHPNR